MAVRFDGFLRRLRKPLLANGALTLKVMLAFAPIVLSASIDDEYFPFTLTVTGCLLEFVMINLHERCTSEDLKSLLQDFRGQSCDKGMKPCWLGLGNQQDLDCLWC